MTFAIRDLLWLMVVFGVGLAWLATAHRSALIEARMQAAERQLAECKATSAALAFKNKDDVQIADALSAAFRKAELTGEQRNELRRLFKEELESRGIEIVNKH